MPAAHSRSKMEITYRLRVLDGDGREVDPNAKNHPELLIQTDWRMKQGLVTLTIGGVKYTVEGAMLAHAAVGTCDMSRH